MTDQQNPYDSIVAIEKMAPCPLCGLPITRDDRPAHGRIALAHDNCRVRLEPPKPVPPVDRSKVELTDGSPVTEDHREINPETGQQKGYIVLSPEERSKGFVRPVRRSYTHIGQPAPKYPLRDLTNEEKERYSKYGYAKFEAYPESGSAVTGKFWRQEELDAIGKGCRTNTRMSQEIAETYARDPKFYGGTFCSHCRAHYPVDQFVWEGTNETVGS
jgi:hypothetical protein